MTRRLVFLMFASVLSPSRSKRSPSKVSATDGSESLTLLATPAGFVHRHQACVNGSNLQLYPDKSIQECAEMCNDDANCLAFEYGVNHGGSRQKYQPRDCQTQSSAEFAGCWGKRNNLDLYIKTTGTDPPIGYDHQPKTCVFGSNLRYYSDKSLNQCAELCSNDAKCRAFEYGVNYGGSLRTYEPQDCRTQSSAELAGCDGEDNNLDLYIKTAPIGYDHRHKACVWGSNLKVYPDKSIQECAELCNDEARCRAFEYGVEYGGSRRTYKVRDCRIQSSAEFEGCDGEDNNLDLYIRTPLIGYDLQQQACVYGSNSQVYPEKSIQECAELCNDDAECRAFEYGADYGGSRRTYTPRDCRVQSSAEFAECDGKDNNLDLYIKTAPIGYDHRHQACVWFSNLQLYPDRSIQECAELCNDDANCLAFEYGVNHGGSGETYKPRDCQTQSSANFKFCDGFEENLDLYIKNMLTR